MRKRFPTFAVTLLVFSVIWLLSDLKLITIDVPWIPVILIVVSLAMIFNKYSFSREI